MKKLLIVIIGLVVLSSLVCINIKSNYENSKKAENNKWYEDAGRFKYQKIAHDYTDPSDIISTYEWIEIWFEDDKLFFETQDSRWYKEVKIDNQNQIEVETIWGSPFPMIN